MRNRSRANQEEVSSLRVELRVSARMRIMGPRMIGAGAKMSAREVAWKMVRRERRSI